MKERKFSLFLVEIILPVKKMFKTGSQVPVMPDGIHYSGLCPAKAYVTETGKSSHFTTSSVFTSHCFHSAQSQTGRVFVVSGSHLAVPRAYPCLCAQGELLCSSGGTGQGARAKQAPSPLCYLSNPRAHICDNATTKSQKSSCPQMLPGSPSLLSLCWVFRIKARILSYTWLTVNQT